MNNEIIEDAISAGMKGIYGCKLRNVRDNCPCENTDGKCQFNELVGFTMPTENLDMLTKFAALRDARKSEPMYQYSFINSGLIWYDAELTLYEAYKDNPNYQWRIVFTSPQPQKSEPVGEVVMCNEPEWMKPRECFKWYQQDFCTLQHCAIRFFLA